MLEPVHEIDVDADDDEDFSIVREQVFLLDEREEEQSMSIATQIEEVEKFTITKFQRSHNATPPPEDDRSPDTNSNESLFEIKRVRLVIEDEYPSPIAQSTLEPVMDEPVYDLGSIGRSADQPAPNAYGDSTTIGIIVSCVICLFAVWVWRLCANSLSSSVSRTGKRPKKRKATNAPKPCPEEELQNINERLIELSHRVKLFNSTGVELYTDRSWPLSKVGCSYLDSQRNFLNDLANNVRSTDWLCTRLDQKAKLIALREQLSAIKSEVHSAAHLFDRHLTGSDEFSEHHDHTLTMTQQRDEEHRMFGWSQLELALERAISELQFAQWNEMYFVESSVQSLRKALAERNLLHTLRDKEVLSRLKSLSAIDRSAANQLLDDDFAVKSERIENQCQRWSEEDRQFFEQIIAYSTDSVPSTPTLHSRLPSFSTETEFSAEILRLEQPQDSNGQLPSAAVVSQSTARDSSAVTTFRRQDEVMLVEPSTPGGGRVDLQLVMEMRSITRGVKEKRVKELYDLQQKREKMESQAIRDADELLRHQEHARHAALLTRDRDERELTDKARTLPNIFNERIANIERAISNRRVWIDRSLQLICWVVAVVIALLYFAKKTNCRVSISRLLGHSQALDVILSDVEQCFWNSADLLCSSLTGCATEPEASDSSPLISAALGEIFETHPQTRRAPLASYSSWFLLSMAPANIVTNAVTTLLPTRWRCFLQLMAFSLPSVFVSFIVNWLGWTMLASYLSTIAILVMFSPVIFSLMRNVMWTLLVIEASHFVCYWAVGLIDKADWSRLRMMITVFVYCGVCFGAALFFS